MTHLCLQNIAVSISYLVYLSVSLRGALELKLVSALVLEEISHDYERHSNVAIFLHIGAKNNRYFRWRA